MGTVNFAFVGPSHHMCVQPDPGSHPTDAYSSVECPGEKFMGKPVPFDRITPDVMQGDVVAHHLPAWTMSTLSLPPFLASPRQDAIDLYKAFKGNPTQFSFPLPFRSLFCSFPPLSINFDEQFLEYDGLIINRGSLSLMVFSLFYNLVQITNWIVFANDDSGFGCDSAAVVNILAHRDATQRALIQQEYKTMYSEELTSRLSSELGGTLKA
ncbi:hypothetical protein GW17_00006746 [Ensete ventricosum]|nr:hypothetical protein GW17_00006746 [Ensete ventricosum]